VTDKSLRFFSRSGRNAIGLHPVPCVPADAVADTPESFRPALARRGIAIEAHLDASGGTQALIFKILSKKTN
jgi:hypothetical protein